MTKTSHALVADQSDTTGRTRARGGRAAVGEGARARHVLTTHMAGGGAAPGENGRVRFGGWYVGAAVYVYVYCGDGDADGRGICERDAGGPCWSLRGSQHTSPDPNPAVMDGAISPAALAGSVCHHGKLDKRFPGPVCQRSFLS